MNEDNNEESAQVESLFCKSEAFNEDFDQSGLFRSKNQKDGVREVIYEVKIEKDKGDGVLTTQSQSFTFHVKNLHLVLSYSVTRSYDDFAWLYTALKVAFPGLILPYFSSSQVIDDLIKKLAYLNHRERQIYLVSRLQELRYFLDYIINHPLCGLSEEVRIFFTENRDDFLREKMQIDNSISEMNVIENSSEKVLSFFQRGITWFSGSPEDNFHPSKAYIAMKCKIDEYSEQLYNLTQKIILYKHSKEDQISWKGPNTEIDAVQLLTAKVTSGKPATEDLVAQIESRVLLPLISECKKERQLIKLLLSKLNTEKSIHFLKQSSGNETKLSKILSRDQQFRVKFSQQWIKFQASWLQLMRSLESNFQEIMEVYSRQMYKIWK